METTLPLEVNQAIARSESRCKTEVKDLLAHVQEARDVLGIKEMFIEDYPSFGVQIAHWGCYLTIGVRAIKDIAPVLREISARGYKRGYIGEYSKRNGSMGYGYGWITVTAVIHTDEEAGTCKRVKVGTRTFEEDIYEVICSEASVTSPPDLPEELSHEG